MNDTSLRAKRALHKLFKSGGVEAVPLAHEHMRPLLMGLRDVADKCGCGLVVAEQLDHSSTNNGHIADRLLLGIMALPDDFVAVVSEIADLVTKRPEIRMELEKLRSVPPKQSGMPGILLFHDDLWLPTSALLRERQH